MDFGSKKVLCLEKRYGNFTYGKVYEATPGFTKGLGKYKQPAEFRITDDDGDYYTIAHTVNELSKNWKWVD